MCGIYGLLSPRDVASPPGDEFFRHLDALLHDATPEFLASGLSDRAVCERIVAGLQSLQAAAGRWTDRAAAMALLGDSSLVERLRQAVERINGWVEAVGRASESGQTVIQEHRELLNQLSLGGKDIAWQIERDVLENLDSVRSVTASSATGARIHAWELNLVLRSLDRLEVRGRDSAGIAVYARFPSSDELERFLDRRQSESPVEGAGIDGDSVSTATIWRERLEAREDPRRGHRSVTRPTNARDTLLFMFKVASEVGKMGDNVAALRHSIAEDPFFQAILCEAEVQLQSLAHTRWASNGVISPANCHPVDSTVMQNDGSVWAESAGNLVAVLNGDIDNYHELVERWVTGCGYRIDPAITTDAKIVPVVVDHFLRECGGDLEEAFRRAFDEFEGSMAIGLMAADRPGQYLFGQKGSGQGLFFGDGGESFAVASEMYGVVELSSRYLKAEGESVESGEIFRLTSSDSRVHLEVSTGDPGDDGDGFAPAPESRWQTAEITTRDINRAGYPHFFLKEITESVDSVRNTIRGKIEVSESGYVRFKLGADALPPSLVGGLREGKVRRIYVIGQGTAAVAAQGVAYLLDAALRRAPCAVTVTAEKATELSAHHLRRSMADTLVVAISQSGTTTDTNRTVDLVRQRGAWVLGIVNRRNSDLVYKSHAVLYTSDGRDIEMSVASTKAFYAQNVAGQILSLALASSLGSMDDDALREAVEDLQRLPDLMQRTLEQQDHIAALARKYALRRRHWAVVGSGASKIAADEIRIKLSELCYKSIAVDYLEDKKHIDLSSEPLVIVCAVGMAREIVSDAVKEVAIFKAHNGIPIVITDEGENGFDPFAVGAVKVPTCRGALSYLPATMAGHLFGYHAAVGMDAVADRLRSLRSRVVAEQADAESVGTPATSIIASLSADAAPLVELEDSLDAGNLDGALDVAHAVRLARVFELLLGRTPIDTFRISDAAGGTVLGTVLESLSGAISELSRPVDAIRHQAKTVTVGISRGEASIARGALAAALAESGVSQSPMLESHRRFVASFDPLVASVEGVSAYRVSGLDPLGRPIEGSRICVESKSGCASEIDSRSEQPTLLSGNKWVVVKRRSVFLGRGQTDNRRILIVPLVSESDEGALVLFHLELVQKGDRDQRLAALAAHESLFDRLRAAVTEVGLEWEPALIDAIDNDTLFCEPVEKVVEALSHTHV